MAAKKTTAKKSTKVSRKTTKAASPRTGRAKKTAKKG